MRVEAQRWPDQLVCGEGADQLLDEVGVAPVRPALGHRRGSAGGRGHAGCTPQTPQHVDGRGGGGEKRLQRGGNQVLPQRAEKEETGGIKSSGQDAVGGEQKQEESRCQRGETYEEQMLKTSRHLCLKHPLAIL